MEKKTSYMKSAITTMTKVSHACSLTTGVALATAITLSVLMHARCTTTVS